MRVIIFLTLLLFSAMAFAAKSNDGGSTWRFQKVVDKITDKVECRINSPFSKRLTFSLQGEGTVYLISSEMAALRQGGELTVRIDKNPPISMYVRNISPLIGAVDMHLNKWFGEMNSGRTLFVRLISDAWGIEEEHSLKGFSAVYTAYKKCIAELR